MPSRSCICCSMFDLHMIPLFCADLVAGMQDIDAVAKGFQQAEVSRCGRPFPVAPSNQTLLCLVAAGMNGTDAILEHSPPLDS